VFRTVESLLGNESASSGCSKGEGIGAKVFQNRCGLCLDLDLYVAIPMYVIRPFRLQGGRELALALWIRHVGQWI
jgi:hypothetical protein